MVAQTKRMLTEVAKLDDLRHGQLAEKASEFASNLVSRLEIDREDLSKKALAAQHALATAASALVKTVARRPYTFAGIGIIAASAAYYFVWKRSHPEATASKQLRKGKKRLVKAFR